MSKSIEWIWFIRVVDTTTPCSYATHPPARPVPDPRGMICTPRLARSLTIADTCAADVGKTTARGRALATVKPSLS